ncbi:MAG: hypothetical protein ACRERC_21910, partial [Candidatus Binatia bacterium]
RPRRRGTGALQVLLVVLWAVPAAAAPVPLRPQYTVRATIEPSAPQIEGTVEVAFTNHTPLTLYDAVVVLFPNRFATEAADSGVNDFTRPFVYPEQEFVPGGMELLAVDDGGVASSAQRLPHVGVPDQTLVRVPIAPLAPGATRQLTLRFRTTVPYRFGSFGEFDGQLTLIGGWYPYLATLDARGAWALDAPPELADFEVTLTPAPGLEMVVNGRHVPAGAPFIGAIIPSVHYLSLIVAPRLLRDETSVAGTRIVFLHRPERLSMRLAFGPTPTQAVLDALVEIVARRPAAVPPASETLVVVEAPLRLNLTAPGEGAVIVSDRMMKLNPVLRPFHELQLAQAVYAELLRPSLAAREPAADYYWVSEGVSRVIADRYMNEVEPERRSVYDWIERLNIFAAVDRFENTPKIPFVNAFFERSKQADPLHEQVFTFNHDAPPGRVVVGKLRNLVGAAEFDPLLDACLQQAPPLRTCVVERLPQFDMQTRWAEWTGPYPAIDYRVGQTDFNQPDAGQLRSTVAVRRVTSRPFSEAVTVRLRTLGGADVDLQWKTGGDLALMTAATPSRVYQVIIDPERQVIDDDRANNAWPPRPQVVLDSADVEVSSTEFGFSALVVGRARYDYTKDLALAGFYTNRGAGFTFGGRLHWGEQVDPTRYRHNLYGFYVFQWLDPSFRNDANPTQRTSGNLGGIGLRYDYNNVFWNDFPTDQRRVRLYADWYDKNLGSDFGYLDWGYVASGTVPLWSPRTVAAGQVFNGFSTGFNSVVPNQGLYSLGGQRSIRGIGAEDDLARNIFVVRTELRQQIYPELDLNLLDFLVLRRHEIHLLVDTGNVSNSAGRIYDVSRFAVGVGGGIGVVYDFFGFFSANAYFEVATRVDDGSEAAGDVQFLFGSGQSF